MPEQKRSTFTFVIMVLSVQSWVENLFTDLVPLRLLNTLTIEKALILLTT